MPLPTRSSSAALAAAAVAALGAFAAPPAAAAGKKSCLRGGATLEAVSGDVRVVRKTVKRRSAGETRREHLLACWAGTGRRTTIAEDVDLGDDNRSYVSVEIVQERYVGVREHNEGGVAENIRARIYDARTRKLLHTSAECDDVEQGDFSGVTDVAFLDGGGLAMACHSLLLYRKAGSALETIEPAGTRVGQLGVSRYTHGFGQRLFWTVATDDGEVTKSLVL